MPPLHIFLLALLGGFVFVSQWYPTRYYTLRSDGYRLIFTASIAGAFFLFLASLLAPLILWCPKGPELSALWHQFVRPTDSGKAALAFLMGLSLWYPSYRLGKRCRLVSDAAAIEFAIGRKQDPLEMFLRRALGSKRLISLTLKSGKVYIGTLQSNFNPAFSMESISLLLSHSGYRDKNTLQMRLAIDYQQTHQKILADLKEKYKDALEQALSQKPEATNEELKASVGAEFSAEAEVQHFEIIIPVTEIQSVNLFDEKIYDEYFRKKTPILSSYRMQ